VTCFICAVALSWVDLENSDEQVITMIMRERVQFPQWRIHEARKILLAK
jgi:hypothetical protein